MPQPSARVAETLSQISSATLIRVDGRLQPRPLPVPMLGVLVLESLMKYFQAPASFGQTRRSFDHGMKPFFNYLAFHTDRRAELEALVALYAQSKRPRITRRIGTKAVPDYLADLGKKVAFASCVRDLFSERLVPPGVAFATGQPQQFEMRGIKASIGQIHCENPEEINSDEIYFFTGASLIDFTGTWKKTTAQSALANGIGEGSDVPLQPSGVATLFDWELQNPSDDITVAPVAALCSVSLMEHEHGNTRRIYEAFNAAYSTAQLLSALATGAAGGPLGIATSVVGILISLAIALDGDDQLGSAVFRFDDVLGGAAVTTSTPIEAVIEGSHFGNAFNYRVRVDYAEEDLSVPQPPELVVHGPTTLQLRDRGEGTYGCYSIACASPLDQIVWSVAAVSLDAPVPGSPAFVGAQGERRTMVEFRAPGSFRVAASAHDQAAGTSRSGNQSARVNLVEEPEADIPRNPR